MDEIVSRLVYLIPIALFIGVRILNAGARQKNAEQQKASNEALVKKIDEARRNPAYADALTEDTGVYIPPVKALLKTQAPSAFSENPVVWPSTPKAAKKKKASLAAAEAAAKKALEAFEIKPDTTSDVPVEAVNVSASRPSSVSVQPIDNIARLTPLQQAVVWSEILGTPRGM
jgi:hypothetical protein